MLPVTFDYDDESDAAAPGRPPGYPIPEEAKTQQKWIEGGLAGNDPNADGDRHMLLVDRDNRMLYELYALHWNGSQWTAGSGATFPLDANARRPEGWTSADAAGLAILPGLIRYDEVYGGVPIRHAFRVTIRHSNGYVFPASHRAGSTRGALPMGARLRLKASKDISNYPDPLRRIAVNAGQDGSVIVQEVKTLPIGQGYDAARDDFGDMQKKGIIDPVKVTRSALENAVSIAGMVLTTNCLVTDIPESSPAGAGAPPMY